MKNKILHIILFVSASILSGQEITVSGIITGSDIQDPLIGVSILIKGTDRGTTSDIDGSYQLEVTTGAILQFSYIGYKTEEITVDRTYDRS